MVIEMETKLVTKGNGYAFYVPKGFISCKTLDPNQRYKLVIETLKKEIKKENEVEIKAFSETTSRDPCNFNYLKTEPIRGVV